VLIALALALAFVWRFRGRALLRIPAVLACGGMVAVFLSQSLPLRNHDEFKGSFELSAQISALSPGGTGIYLWDNGSCCNKSTKLLATAVWLQHGEVSVLLPSEVFRRQDVLKQYASTYPGQPVFVVSSGDTLPEGINPSVARKVLSVDKSLPMWDESDVVRPSTVQTVPLHFNVWKIGSA
jgi:hypothetical protein